MRLGVEWRLRRVEPLKCSDALPHPLRRPPGYIEPCLPTLGRAVVARAQQPAMPVGVHLGSASPDGNHCANPPRGCTRVRYFASKRGSAVDPRYLGAVAARSSAVRAMMLGNMRKPGSA
jgi:hypothetical protein